MNQENKLLLQELSTRMPHGLFVAVKETDDGSTMVPLYDEDGNIDETNEPNIHSLVSCNCYGECDIDDYSTVTINEIIPYLRPMSSMTEEEKKELEDICTICNSNTSSTYEFFGIEIFNNSRYGTNFESDYTAIDWLNSHHFDYRGLIERGLGLDCTGLNIYDNEKSI